MAAMMEGAVSAALVSGQYAGVIDEFEQHEMIMGEDVPDDWPYAVHMLIHVLTDDLRCVVGKGEDWPADADLHTAFAVLQALWNTEYAAAHAAIDAYLATVAAGAAVMMMGRVLAAVQARLRAQALALVRKGYSSIHISSLGDLLGFAAAAGAAAPSREEGALAAVTAEGWRYDADTGYVFITSAAADEGLENTTITSEHLQQLTDYAVHLARS